MGRKLGRGLRPLFAEGELGSHLTMAEAYLHAKFHLDPSNSNRLATVNERYRQIDRQDNGPIA